MLKLNWGRDEWDEEGAANGTSENEEVEGKVDTNTADDDEGNEPRPTPYESNVVSPAAFSFMVVIFLQVE